jgi:hypothetical protein
VGIHRAFYCDRCLAEMPRERVQIRGGRQLCAPCRDGTTEVANMCIRMAAALFGVDPAIVRYERTRLQRFSAARQLAMYLIRETTRLSFPWIGDFFSHNHSTVIHACQVTRRRLLERPELGRKVAAIAAELRDANARLRAA